MRGQEEPAAPIVDASRFRVAIVVSRFNSFVTSLLRDAAVEMLREAGVADSGIEIFDVPGAFEIPQAARALAETGRFDAIVCLGCLIRGETAHFEYIATAVAHGITAAAADTGVPMSFGVLTTNTPEQALERSAAGPDNKGREAAAAAIQMAALYRSLLEGNAAPRLPG